jgi:hypothetical protein
VYRQESDTMQTLLAGEEQLLDLVSADATLSYVLDKVCTALDVQVGNIVSVALLLHDEEHCSHELARNAVLFGLSSFCSRAILSQCGELLGTFETYCCCPRSPSRVEQKLIERAAQIASLAIQFRINADNFRTYTFPWNSMLRRNAHRGMLPGN